MKKIVLKIAGLLLIGVAVFCIVRFFLNSYSPKNLKTEQMGPVETTVYTEDEQPAQADLAADDGIDSDEAQPSEEAIPVDFAALQAINPDIYAWIEIPGTDISYPVAQREGNDSYYLRTNSDGQYSAGGAIFTEASYNSKLFDDPVTIVYGHHMRAGNIMFGHLQEYFSDQDFLNGDPLIKIYTPDRIFMYRLFAAVPYSREHILYYNDMSDASVFDGFFEGVANIRELGSYVDDSLIPHAADGDKVLILSTCLAGNNTRRFLVMGVLS